MQVILNTARLYLRRFNYNDADAALILHMNSQPEVLKYLHEPILQDLDHAKAVLKNIILPQHENKLGRWAVQLTDNNEFIGWCGFKQRPERNNEIDLGYRFEPVAWGRGYATEAARACLSYAFTNLALEKINACAHVENRASIKVLENIGMQYHGDDTIDDCPVKCFELLKKNYPVTSALS